MSAQDLTAAVRSPKHAGEPALVAYLTAGHPTLASFPALLHAVADVADVVEIGVPFSDPMADGLTIQESSRIALDNGVSVRWILDQLAALERRPAAPLILFGYLNPLLAFGVEALAARAAEVGVSGFIVPDLPFEESESFRAALAPHGLGLVQLVTPVTPPDRARRLAEASAGFLYAVTRTGITGAGTDSGGISDYLASLRAVSPVPVCAGFGIRERAQVREIAPHADGVVVGSALVEVIGRDGDPGAFLAGLMGDT